MEVMLNNYSSPYSFWKGVEKKASKKGEDNGGDT